MPETALPSRSKLLLAVALCIAAAFAAFGMSVNHGFLMFDDPYLVVNNLAAHGPTPSHIKTAFTTYDPELYIPLTLISYQINYLFAGLNPVFYHITNLALHGLNAFLFGLILLLILKRERLALVFALIYAVHPLNTETAVWIAARKDTLSTLFFFASIVSYLRYSETGRQGLYRWSIALAVLASLSKASVFTLPFLLPLLDFLRSKQTFSAKRSVKSMLPFLGVALITAAIAFAGKTRVIESSSLVETALMAAKSTVFYLEKILWPSNLTAIYPYTKAISAASPDFYVPVIIVLLIISLSVGLMQVSPWPATVLALFIITLGPSYFNFHKGTAKFFAVDRYAYIGIAWVLLLIAKGVLELYERNDRVRKPLAAAGALIICALALTSMRQTSLWRDDEAVFGNALRHYPESVTARVSLAVWYRQSGRMNDELRMLQEGLRYSRDTALLLGIGSVYVREGKGADAEKLFREAMEKDPKNPEPYFYLGSLDEDRGRPDDAVTNYRKAIELDPSYVSAYNNLAAIELDRNDLAEAERLIRIALKWNPNFMEGHMNLFEILETEKKTDEAFLHLEEAYELSPDQPDILLDYGYRLSTRGRNSEAIGVLEHLMEIDPNNHSGERILRRLKPSWNPEPDRIPKPSGNLAPL